MFLLPACSLLVAPYLHLLIHRHADEDWCCCTWFSPCMLLLFFRAANNGSRKYQVTKGENQKEDQQTPKQSPARPLTEPHPREHTQMVGMCPFLPARFATFRQPRTPETACVQCTNARRTFGNRPGIHPCNSDAAIGAACAHKSACAAHLAVCLRVSQKTQWWASFWLTNLPSFQPWKLSNHGSFPTMEAF